MQLRLPAGAFRWSLRALAALGLSATTLSASARPAPAPLRLADASDFVGTSGPVVATPADLFGPLYRAVQLAHVFSDGKTFADAVPRRDTGAILNNYRTQHPRDR